jgi:hypothetical protein
MAVSGNQNLPPLPELLEEIDFPVYGLDASYLTLQLRSLHYGVEEKTKRIVGLGLYYAQKYLSSPQVLAVESSLLPDTLGQDDRSAALEWSWSNLVGIRDTVYRLHTPEPAAFLDEEMLELQYQESIIMLQGYPWSRLTQKSTIALLTGLEVSRGPDGDILARRFDSSHMLLAVSMGLEPDQFIGAIKKLVVLQDYLKAVLRHQEEFERIMAG